MNAMVDNKPSALASAVRHERIFVSEGDAPTSLITREQVTHATAIRVDAFTFAEILVTISVLVLLVVLFMQLLNSATTITTLGHKQMDADSQARQLLDRMAIDVAQMVKRSDVDYYVKSSASAPLRRVLQPGNDQIAFYSNVPGYYPTTGAQSPSRSSPIE